MGCRAKADEMGEDYCGQAKSDTEKTGRTPYLRGQARQEGSTWSGRMMMDKLGNH